MCAGINKLSETGNCETRVDGGAGALVPVCLHAIQHAMFECGGNTNHKVHIMLISQFHPSMHGVALILGKHAGNGTGQSSGIKKEHPVNAMSARNCTPGKFRSAARAVSRDGGGKYQEGINQILCSL